MRISSFIVLALGIVLLGSNGYDESRGITSAPSHGYRRYSFLNSSSQMLFKQDNAEQLRNAMTYHWAMAIIISLVGVVWLVVSERMERNDPMAPDSDEKIDEELKQDEADEKGDGR